MKPMRFLILSCVLAGLAIGPLQAQGAVEYQRPEPKIFRGSAAQPLTLPANASPVATVARFLKEKGRNDATASSVVAVAQSQLQKGVSHARMEQRINGLLVYDGYVKAAFGARGELVHLIDGLANVPPGKIAKPSVDEKTALSSALRALYPAQNLNPGQVRHCAAWS